MSFPARLKAGVFSSAQTGLETLFAGRLHRGSHCVRKACVADDKPQDVNRIVCVASEYGRYGYRRMTALLRAEDWWVNHKRTERIWRQEGLKVTAKQAKRRRLRLGDGSCIRPRPTHRNHVWSYDVVMDRTADDRVFRMLTTTDGFTREGRAIDVSRKLCGEDVLEQLSDLFVRRGVPDHIRSDNGSGSPPRGAGGSNGSE